MSEFYQIDSTRVSHAEMLWWHKSPAVLISWLHKWFRLRTPCSSDDPNTDSTLPFVTESLPPVISDKFIALANEIAALGFGDPVHHVIHDAGARTTYYWATFRHESGKYFARIHQRIWQVASRPDRGTFLMFFTAFSDGTYLVSSAGKPDMAAPATVRMTRMPGISTERLWEKHRQISESMEDRRVVIPVRSATDLINLTERHHVLVRDFHLARGVFRVRNAGEHAQAESYQASVAEAQSAGLQYPEIMAELDRLQDGKSTRANTFLILTISAVLFVLLGVLRWNWGFTLLIIPVLLFHESGHWVAMRLFHYRNLRMFFIPLFGAAVTGQNWNVPGWKKALVSLAGPLPGIALGVVLGIAGLVTDQTWLNQVALLLVFINGLNLLPFLPMDGGRVLHVTLFCRNRWLDIIFRIVTVAGLLLLFFLNLGRFTLFLAIVTAIGLPLAFRLGRVTDALRHADLPPPEPGQDRIPVVTAQAIIGALKTASLPATGNKTIAQQTLTIFETLNAHPPGVLGTLGILILQGGAFLVAVVFALVLILGKMGGLGGLLSAAITQARLPVQCDTVQTWPSAGSPTNWAAIRNVVVATFPDHARAASAFDTVTGKGPAFSHAALYGESVLLALPGDDDAARRQWFDQFQALTTNVFVAPTNLPVIAHLTFVCATLPAATNLELSLDDYFTLAGDMHLIPPWSPAARSPDFAAYVRAREQWKHITEKVADIWNDPALAAIQSKMTDTIRSGDLAERDRLTAELVRTRQQVQARVIDQMRADVLNPIDPALLDLKVRESTLDETNQAAHAALMAEVAEKLGAVKSADGQLAPGTEDYGTGSALVVRTSLMINISYLPFNDVVTGLPGMSGWLCDQGCQGIRYELMEGETSDDSD